MVVAVSRRTFRGIAPAPANDIRQGDRPVVRRELAQPRRHEVDVHQIAQETPGRKPQTGDSIGVGHPHRAQGDPPRLGARGGGDSRRPWTEGPAGEMEILTAVGPPRGPPTDEEQHAEIEHHHGADGGDRGGLEPAHRRPRRQSRTVSATTRIVSTKGKTHNRRWPPSERLSCSMGNSLPAPLKPIAIRPSGLRLHRACRARHCAGSTIRQRGAIHTMAMPGSLGKRAHRSSPRSEAGRRRAIGGVAVLPVTPARPCRWCDAREPPNGRRLRRPALRHTTSRC